MRSTGFAPRESSLEVLRLSGSITADTEAIYSVHLTHALCDLSVHRPRPYGVDGQVSR